MKITEGDAEFQKQLVALGTISCNFGGDPEFFVSDPDGTILNSDRFFPGKEKPILVHPDDNVHVPDDNAVIGKVYFDGIQAELGFSPSTCRDTTVARIRNVIAAAYKKIGNNEIVLKPAVRVKKAIIDQADPQARIFGCAPDFSAYTRGVNTPPMDASKHLYRYAGGHIHIGTSEYTKLDKEALKDPENHIAFIKALDLVVSLPLLALDNAPGSKLRRSKYGKAGCFRPTPYGLEYRTPSCWWLQSPVTFSLAYGLARLSWTLSCNKVFDKLMSIAKLDEEKIRGIVDEGDVKEAAKVWSKIRPYITMMGTAFSNPVSCLGHAPWHVPYTTDLGNNKFNYNDLERIATAENKIRDGSDPVAARVMLLPLYEYMVKNGTEGILGKIKEEWGVNQTAYSYGMYSGAENKIAGAAGKNSYLAPLKIRQDFFKFQKSYFKEVY